MMNAKEKEIFEALCAAESYATLGYGVREEEGIGIYNEKRLHRILKRTVCDRESCFELKVGRYTADVLCDGHIFEIQSASLLPLRQKIAFYLEATDLKVTVVRPLIVKRKIIRADRESGEVLRVRSSPKKAKLEELPAIIRPLAEFVNDPRFSLKVMLVELEEYRYSEAVRYRKSGKYDSEVFPTKLVGSIEFCSVDDYRVFFPRELCGCEFCAADFAPYTTLRGRDLYAALNAFAAMGMIDRRKDGKRVIYKA